jgi:hypothetical protein
MCSSEERFIALGEALSPWRTLVGGVTAYQGLCATSIQLRPRSELFFGYRARVCLPIGVVLEFLHYESDA